MPESSVEGLDQHVESLGLWARIQRYFRPMGRKAYYLAAFHLLVLNFPFALLAWVYLFVFTLVGQISADLFSTPSSFFSDRPGQHCSWCCH